MTPETTEEIMNGFVDTAEVWYEGPLPRGRRPLGDSPRVLEMGGKIKWVCAGHPYYIKAMPPKPKEKIARKTKPEKLEPTDAPVAVEVEKEDRQHQPIIVNSCNVPPEFLKLMDKTANDFRLIAKHLDEMVTSLDNVGAV